MRYISKTMICPCTEHTNASWALNAIEINTLNNKGRITLVGYKDAETLIEGTDAQ